MGKLLLVIIFAFLFNACSSQTLSFGLQNNELKFKVPNNAIYTVKLTNPIIFTNYDRCSTFSYTLNETLNTYGKVFIEDINLHSNCQFNVEALGALTYEFKEQLRLKSFEKVEELSFGNYEFLTYKVNDTSYVSIIYIYTPFSMRFMVDYEGKVYNELLLQFDKTYKNNFLHQKRFDANYTYSIVKMNMFKHYFDVMSEDFSQ
jgi:hypothetical protein